MFTRYMSRSLVVVLLIIAVGLTACSRGGKPPEAEALIVVLSPSQMVTSFPALALTRTWIVFSTTLEIAGGQKVPLKARRRY